MDRTVESNGAQISYSLDGFPDAPALVLSNSIGTTRDLWARQCSALASAFRVIRYDTRGHGDSTVPPGDYSVEQLGRDVLAILDQERIDTAHVCGLSLGGITAMWLGVNAPERVTSLVLANTGARLRDTDFWNDRIALVKSKGMGALADRAVTAWFSDSFRDRDPDTVHDFRAMLADCPPDGYIGCCAALRDADLRKPVRSIRARTLIVAGEYDQSTPKTNSEDIRSRIPGSTMATFPCAHLSNVECAADFTTRAGTFFAEANVR